MSQGAQLAIAISLVAVAALASWMMVQGGLPGWMRVMWLLLLLLCSLGAAYAVWLLLEASSPVVAQAGSLPVRHLPGGRGFNI